MSPRLSDFHLCYIGYCRKHGILVPREFLSENWVAGAHRYAVIEHKPPISRFCTGTYETPEGLKEAWRGIFTRKHDRPATYSVIDIKDDLVYRVDGNGELQDPKPLGEYERADPKELKARQDARTKSNLEVTLKALFGAGYLNGRRRRIIDEVSAVEISVKSAGGLRKLRIRIAHGPRHDAIAALVAELFDPALRRPLDYVESYPGCVKYRLSGPVIEYHEGPAWMRFLVRAVEAGKTVSGLEDRIGEAAARVFFFIFALAVLAVGVVICVYDPGPFRVLGVILCAAAALGAFVRGGERKPEPSRTERRDWTNN